MRNIIDIISENVGSYICIKLNGPSFVLKFIENCPIKLLDDGMKRYFISKINNDYDLPYEIIYPYKCDDPSYRIYFLEKDKFRLGIYDNNNDSGNVANININISTLKNIIIKCYNRCRYNYSERFYVNIETKEKYLSSTIRYENELYMLNDEDIEKFNFLKEQLKNIKYFTKFLSCRSLLVTLSYFDPLDDLKMNKGKVLSLFYSDHIFENIPEIPIRVVIETDPCCYGATLNVYVDEEKIDKYPYEVKIYYECIGMTERYYQFLWYRLRYSGENDIFILSSEYNYGSEEKIGFDLYLSRSNAEKMSAYFCPEGYIIQSKNLKFMTVNEKNIKFLFEGMKYLTNRTVRYN